VPETQAKERKGEPKCKIGAGNTGQGEKRGTKVQDNCPKHGLRRENGNQSAR